VGQVLSAYQARIASGGLIADSGQAVVATRLDALAQDLSRWKPDAWFGRSAAPRGLYIHGGVGRGKSMLMDLFFAEAKIARKRRVHFHAFMQDIHASLRAARARRGDGQEELLAAAAKDVASSARLLCFDELQVTDIADAMIVGRLVEDLLARDVVIVATSNRAPDDLYKNGLNRQLFLPFIELIKARFDIVAISAARDYRLERLMEAPVWHAPLNPLAEHAMDRAWARLTLEAAPQPLGLEVQGRKLLIPRFAAGVGRASFAELCARPLGPPDYLAIAEHVHTLLIDGVPKLTPDRREEAARLRILVDALYEAKTKLVASAAAEPFALYPEGDQSFEFERTASRLMEMRSAAYLALPRRDAEFMRGVVE
jgi:cell division protein ZapE